MCAYVFYVVGAVRLFSFQIWMKSVLSSLSSYVMHMCWQARCLRITCLSMTTVFFFACTEGWKNSVEWNLSLSLSLFVSHSCSHGAKPTGITGKIHFKFCVFWSVILDLVKSKIIDQHTFDSTYPLAVHKLRSYLSSGLLVHSTSHWCVVFLWTWSEVNVNFWLRWQNDCKMVKCLSKVLHVSVKFENMYVWTILCVNYFVCLCCETEYNICCGKW